KLSDGGYPPEAVDAAIEYLRSFHYIDDMRYAEDYVRFKSRSFSRRQIMMKLAEKGIGKDICEAAFAKYDEENGLEDGDVQKELIRKLIAKRCPNGTSNLDHDERRKLYSYLYGKGFSISDIDDVLDIT
nr:RecX family transcriptional regulator [Saccharofermentans sp.]